MTPDVAVIGLGKIGLPLAVQVAGKGFRVRGADISARVVGLVSGGSVPFPGEPGLADRLRDVTGSGLLTATTDTAAAVAASDAVIVVVPLVTDSAGQPDFGAVDSATAAVAAGLRPGTLVSYETTLPVHTTRRRLAAALAVGSGLAPGRDFALCHSPERVSSGRVFADLRRYPKLVGGIDGHSGARAEAFYRSVFDFDERPDLPRPNGVWDLGSPEATEFAKLAETTYRDVNIALANEFAEISDGFSIDPIEVIDAAASKPYGFMAFHPGPGVGGHCIPCDPHYLLWQLRATQNSAPLVTQAMQAIAERPRQVVDRILNTLSRNGKGMAGARILVVGVTYKPGVQDVRSSSALDIIDLLAEKGAKVGYYDPLVPNVRVTGGSLDTVAEPAGEDWDVALIHTIQPGQGYDWLGDVETVIDATYRFDPALFAA